MKLNRLMGLLLIAGLTIGFAGCEATGGGDGGGDTNGNSNDSMNDNGSNGDNGNNDGGDNGNNDGGNSDGGDNSSNDNSNDSGGDNSGDNSNTNDNAGGDGSNDNANDNGNDDSGDGSNDNDNDNGNDDMNDEMPVASNTWSQGSQPCGGTQTNAFWFDSATRGYIGCGENAQGAGLYVTDDGGETWDAEPLFNNTRINDIRRGPDGVLYATGTDATDGYEVFVIDESNALRQLVGLYTASNSAFLAVSQGENIAITQDGQLMVDSLTGTQMAYRSAGATEFMELGTFIDTGINDPNASSAQVSRVIAHNNHFWAAGGLINLPAAVYFPSSEAGATYHMTKLELQSSNRDGEMHDIYVWSDTSALICGFDQSLSFPLIYRLNGDPNDLNNWTQISLFDFGINYQGGAWRLSVVGDRVVMVGQTFPDNNGFVLLSEDRGLTWSDISPVDENGGFVANLMTNVRLFDDGSILAAGQSGELWRYNP